MSGVGKRNIRLPPELIYLIVKDLEDTDRLALSLSGAFEGFDYACYTRRKETGSIKVNYKHHFLTLPNLWYSFLRQHASSPSAITIFIANNCYWIPVELLCGTIVKMTNLKELSIKDTKVSLLSDLARVMKHCKKLTKFDFSFLFKESKCKAISAEDAISIKQGFKKLKSLNVSTCVPVAEDYGYSKWMLIFNMLSWCQSCTELTIEITQTCNESEYQKVITALTPDLEMETRKKFERYLQLPHFEWMFNLKKLVLIKLGSVTDLLSEDRYTVSSLALDELFSCLFTEVRQPQSLQHLWVQGFELKNTPHLAFWRTARSKKSYFLDVDNSEEDRDEDDDRLYDKIENLAENWTIACLGTIDFDDEFCSTYLPNLKHMHVLRYDYDNDYIQGLNNFIGAHRNLECLIIQGYTANRIPDLASGEVLHNLKALTIHFEIVNKNRIKKLTEICPNIELFRLNVCGCLYDNATIMECLSAIRFPNLTSLSLFGRCLKLQDGAFLLPIIHACPKLKDLHLEGLIQPDLFFTNFDLFLKSAVNLRDLRLGLELEQIDGSPFLSLMKSVQKFAPNLERLSWVMNCSYIPPVVPFNSEDGSCSCSYDWKHPPKTTDYVVEFAKEMKRLVCCCLIFYYFDENMCNQVNSRIEKEVVSLRPSLWFVMDCFSPKVTYPNVPLIHYHEMVDAPFNYFPPPTF